MMHTTYIIFFFVIAFPRIFFIIFFPETGGDYEIYSTVAKNILNGCGVSLSDPLTNECIPHFGGNHGPGYPLFISTIWFISDSSNYLVRITQTFIYSLSCLWLMRSIHLLYNKKNIVIILGFVLAMSPLLIAWPRYIQTETLSIAATIFLLAELILSIVNKKIRIISIAVALILATWIRLDNIFLTIPVAVIVIYIHGFKIGILKGFLIAFILSSTWGLWTLRNIEANLPSLLPSDMIMPDGSRPPKGYLKWTKTWITHEYERPGALWGINRKNYDSISIPERAYADLNEKLKVTELLKILEKSNKKDFPLLIDNEFKNIAENKIDQNRYQYWIKYPFIRAIRIWTNPFSSFGWPNEMPDRGITKEERMSAASGNTKLLFQKAIEYPLHAISKGFNAAYRGALMILLLYSMIKLFKNRDDFLFPIGLMTISYILARTLFFSFNSNFETRYMVTTIPFIELIIILTLYPILIKRK